MDAGCFCRLRGAWSGGVDGGTQVVREKESKVCYLLLFENKGVMGVYYLKLGLTKVDPTC